MGSTVFQFPRPVKGDPKTSELLMDGKVLCKQERSTWGRGGGGALFILRGGIEACVGTGAEEDLGMLQ